VGTGWGGVGGVEESLSRGQRESVRGPLRPRPPCVLSRASSRHQPFSFLLRTPRPARPSLSYASAAATSTGRRLIVVPPFSRISVCTPLINVLVSPAGAGNYSLLVESADPVPVKVDVLDDELVIGTDGPFSTNRAIKVVIFAPADALTKLSAAPLTADIFVDKGFTADTFTVTSHLSTGKVVLRGLDKAKTVFLAGSGAANFLVNATNATVKVDLGGVSSAALFSPGEVDLLLSGAAAVDVYGRPGTTKVRGAALGANSVNVPPGTACEVTGPFGLGSPCVRVGSMPDVALIPLWSCGLRSDGPFTCPAPEKNGGAGGIQAAAAPAAAPGALATQPLAQADAIMAQAPAASTPGGDVASGGRRLAQAAAAVGGGGGVQRGGRGFAGRGLPTLENFAGSMVSLLPCVERPIDLVVGMM
jgi:hypothetical protein